VTYSPREKDFPSQPRITISNEPEAKHAENNGENMSALLSRDGNAQHTSGSTGGDKQMAAGTENRPQDAQHKHGVAQKVADEKEYVIPMEWKLRLWKRTTAPRIQ